MEVQKGIDKGEDGKRQMEEEVGREGKRRMDGGG
jgi:hypothetical protein